MDGVRLRERELFKVVPGGDGQKKTKKKRYGEAGWLEGAKTAGGGTAGAAWFC